MYRILILSDSFSTPNRIINKHELIAAVQALAIEYGRIPSRDQFAKTIKNGKFLVDAAFGSYTTFLMAAGLKDESAKELGNEIFQKDLASVLSEVTTQPPEKQLYTPTLCIPDVHFPFENQYTLDEIYKFNDKYKPKRIIQIGDLYDMYAHSRFPRSQNIYTPRQEEDLGRKAAVEMWATLRASNPEAECIQMVGNHDIRPLKQTLGLVPSLEHVIENHIEKLMSFDAVKSIVKSQEEYIADNIQFIHGYKSGLGRHRDYTLMNTVCGHTHLGGVVYRRLQDKTIWELNCGLAADPDRKVFNYTPQKFTNWTPGFGFIDEYGPRFIPC